LSNTNGRETSGIIVASGVSSEPEASKRQGCVFFCEDGLQYGFMLMLWKNSGAEARLCAMFPHEAHGKKDRKTKREREREREGEEKKTEGQSLLHAEGLMATIETCDYRTQYSIAALQRIPPSTIQWNSLKDPSMEIPSQSPLTVLLVSQRSLDKVGGKGGGGGGPLTQLYQSPPLLISKSEAENLAAWALELGLRR